jgi:cell shape-determining protein MreC
MSEVRIEVIANVPGYFVGEVVKVDADHEGTPTEFFWRRQLKERSATIAKPLRSPRQTRKPAQQADEEQE